MTVGRSKPPVAGILPPANDTVVVMGSSLSFYGGT